MKRRGPIVYDLLADNSSLVVTQIGSLSSIINGANDFTISPGKGRGKGQEIIREINDEVEK